MVGSAPAMLPCFCLLGDRSDLIAGLKMAQIGLALGGLLRAARIIAGKVQTCLVIRTGSNS